MPESLQSGGAARLPAGRQPGCGTHRAGIFGYSAGSIRLAPGACRRKGAMGPGSTHSNSADPGLSAVQPRHAGTAGPAAPCPLQNRPPAIGWAIASLSNICRVPQLYRRWDVKHARQSSPAPRFRTGVSATPSCRPARVRVPRRATGRRRRRRLLPDRRRWLFDRRPSPAAPPIPGGRRRSFSCRTARRGRFRGAAGPGRRRPDPAGVAGVLALAEPRAPRYVCQPRAGTAPGRWSTA